MMVYLLQHTNVVQYVLCILQQHDLNDIDTPGQLNLIRLRRYMYIGLYFVQHSLKAIVISIGHFVDHCWKKMAGKRVVKIE